MSRSMMPIRSVIAMLAGGVLSGCVSMATKMERELRLDGGDFAFVYGFGSGWHGFDVLRVAASGECWYTFAKAGHEDWRSARFRLTPEELAGLQAEVRAADVMELRDKYENGTMDGNQAFLKVRLGERRRVIYFDNVFPPAHERIQDYVQTRILAPRQPTAGVPIRFQDAREGERRPLP